MKISRVVEVLLDQLNKVGDVDVLIEDPEDGWRPIEICEHKGIVTKKKCVTIASIDYSNLDVIASDNDEENGDD